MSIFSPAAYANLAHMMRDRPAYATAIMSNNINVILAALDIAGWPTPPLIAEPEGWPTPPLIAEPEGDGTVRPSLEDEKQREVDRIVQASLASVPATELLRRVTELEKLVHAMATRAVGMSSQAEVHSARNAWLKTRGGEWV
jgi:hypothetical protein